jgi:aldehyde:ferredoxin oxidoreductase
MGAVMGSKKLKAVVVKGGEKVPVSDSEGLKRLSRQVEEMVERYPACRIFRRSGTPVLGTAFSLFKVFSEYNGRRGARVRKAAGLGPRAFNRQFDWEPRGCWNCPLRCHKHYVTKAGKYKGESGAKHEIGYISPLGLTLGVHDLPSMLHLVNVSNRLGLDCREFAGTLGMVVNCLEQDILSASDLGGDIPTWGGVEAAEAWMQAAAYRRGFGDVIADGVRKASMRIGGGAQRYALNIKGMFMENFDSPLSLCAFSVASRGGDHLKGFPFHAINPLRAGDMRRLSGASAWSMIPFSHRDKGRMVWWHENYKMLVDSMGICFFLAMTLGIHGHLFPEELAQAFQFATGIEADGDELMRRAERSYLLERSFNARRGMRRPDDSFVKRPERRSAGKRIDLDHPGMLDEYYRWRGLDADGIPLPRKLRELGLEEIAADMDGLAAVEREDSDVERAHAGH